MTGRFVNSFNTAGSNASACESVCAYSDNSALLLITDTVVAVSVFAILSMVIISLHGVVSVIIPVLANLIVSVVIIRIIRLPFMRPEKAKAY